MVDVVELRNEPTQSRSRETLDRILVAAEKVLEDVGPEHATSRLIAETAGVSVGSLYRFFPDKAAVIRELVNRYVAQMGTVPADDLPDLSAITIDQVEHIVRFMVHRSIALHEQHPAWRKTRVWRYPDTDELASKPIREAEIAMLQLMLQLTAPALVDDKAQLMATTMSLLLWPLFEQALDEPECREVITEEAVIVTTAYVSHRLQAEFAQKAAGTD